MGYIKKEDRHQIELLDEYLNELGLPDKWEVFIEEEKLKEYLIIKNHECYHCLHCDNKFNSLKKVNEYEFCPNCNLKLLVKSNKIKKYSKKRDLILIQKYRKGYVFRLFELMVWLNDNKIKFSIVEWGRQVKDDKFKSINFYLSNNFKNYMGCLNVAHYEETKSWRPYDYYYGISINGKYYYYNFKELFYAINQYSMIWELAKKVDELNFIEVAEDSLISKRNTTELLTKAGLYNLANSCKKYRKKGNFEEIFGVDRSYLKFMLINNITPKELEVLSKIKIKDINLIRYLKEFPDLEWILKNFKPYELYNYKLKPKDFYLYRDYLEFADKLGFDINNKKYRFPKRLKQKHNEYMNLVQINKNKVINEKIHQRYENLLKNVFQDDKFIISPADSIESLLDESKQQNNCVKTYNEKYANGDCDIYFMRLIKDKTRSLVTVEVRNNKIIQKRTKNNSITTKEQDVFLSNWEQNIL